MPFTKLQRFLEDEQVPHQITTHGPAFTAQQIAQSVHVSGHTYAKAVILVADGEVVMAVLPATHDVDIDVFAQAIGVQKVCLANEPDLAEPFPGCELGAIPPFGNLWGVPVYLAQMLAEQESLTFNAGTFTEVMTIPMDHYLRVVRPVLFPFAQSHEERLAYEDDLIAAR